MAGDRKRGRPPMQDTEKRRNRIETRLTDAETARLDRYCRQKQTTRADAIRAATLAELDRTEKSPK